MIFDELGQREMLREFEDICLKLVQLTDTTEETNTMKNELVALASRIKKLSLKIANDHLSQKDTLPAKIVLVVDDNDEFRKLVKQLLELADYKVFDASNSYEALEIVKQNTSIDLVLCDIILPDMKGPDLVKEIRGKLPDIEVIFMSGYVSVGIISNDVEQVLTSNNNFLQKPFPNRDLLEAVHEVLVH